MHKFILSLIFTCVFFTSKSQLPNADSLKAKLNENIHDTSKVKIMNSLIVITQYKGDNNESIMWGKKALALAKSIDFKKALGKIYMNLGNTYGAVSKYAEAIESLNEASAVFIETKNKKGLSETYNNMGIIYYNLSDFTKCLEYFQKSLKIQEEIGDKEIMSATIGNIGVIYETLNEDSLAMIYQLRCFEMAKAKNKKEKLLSPLINLGLLFKKKKDFEKALDYMNKALEISLQLGEKATIIKSYGNIGGIYLEMKNFKKSLEVLVKTKKLAEELGDKKDISRIYCGIAEAYKAKGEPASAIIYYKMAYDVSKETGAIQEEKTAAEGLFNSYKEKNDFKNALAFHVIARKLSDSLLNSSKSESLNTLKIQYALDRQESQLKLTSEEANKKQEEEKAKQRIIIYIALITIILIVIFSSFLYKRFKISKEQNKIIESQKLILELKNKEVTDSITYAKRLQEAILPTEEYIKMHLPESFVLYKPKDIVAGDFYWLESVSPMHVGADLIFIAAADCTGHGVPGAIVSMICHNALNRALLEYEITDPGKILNVVRDLVISTFEKSDTDVKDGMDISLGCLNKKTNELLWAGANNPLLIFSKNEKTFKELKGDKQPIGKVDNPKPFNTHKVQLQVGDMLYLFTDGYADQFGGTNGKKFKYKQLTSKLSEMASMPMLEQKNILDNTFTQWKGDLEQVDDICFIGIKIQ